MMKLVPWTKRNRLVGNEDFWAPFGVTTKDWFRDVFDNDFFGIDRTAGFSPALDVSEDTNEYRVNLEVPGINPDDLDISLESGVLTVKGEKKDETEKKDKNYHRVERSYGSFTRSLKFPVDIDSEKIKADYRDGVLHISLPKAETAKQKRIEVKVEK